MQCLQQYNCDAHGGISFKSKFHGNKLAIYLSLMSLKVSKPLSMA